MTTTEAWQAADPLSLLQSEDPNFDQDHFLEFAEMAYFLVKKAVQERNPLAARAFAAEPVFQQLAADAKAMTARGMWPVYDGIFVAGLSVDGASREPGWNYLSVQFSANAALLTMDASGNIVEGSREAQDFEELWTFARSDAARSKVGGGVMEYKCPNCASPLSLTDLGVCQHCGAPVASGQLEWVVVNLGR
jgi:predicted lipid-binding transport protein (Tim44 family)